MKFKALALVTFTLVATSGCLRRQAIDNSSPGYISESACLRLISGQSYSSLDYKPAEAKKMAEVKPFSCSESCECPASVATAKKVNAAMPVSSKTVVKAKPAVVANQLRMNSAVKREVLAVKPAVKPVVKPDVVQSEESAKASLKIAAKSEGSDSHIREVQEALNKKGAKLEVDGQMGERTVRLLKAFQTMNDLPVTGKADEATANALGISTKR